jgi:acyl-coenzyme A synthetase/AMP-(fatty) acid ligase
VKRPDKRGFRFALSIVLVPAIVFLCFRFKFLSPLKWYPVVINLVMLSVFGVSLIRRPAVVFRLAVLQDKTIKGSLAEKRIENYCRKVTIVWCVFFTLNCGAALFTLAKSDVFWALYNGFLSYILMGTLFLGEFVIRKMTAKKMPKAAPLSQFTPSSRPPDMILAYDGAFSNGVYKTWKDFLTDTAALRAAINGRNKRTWLLHAEDCWCFLTAFTALLQCKKQILLTANISPDYIAEITDDNGGAAILSDCVIEGAIDIPAVLSAPVSVSESPPDSGAAEYPHLPINAGETDIIMYTSGTTGKPKAVCQRLAEFETDNAFILSKWGEEILKRKICSTVSQHHIYGLLFSILLPFTAGVPFRRKRMDFPEEFRSLDDVPYMIVTVPSFLKRAAETDAAFNMKDPWIWTSGGVLPKDTAEKAKNMFGFWPLEVYGSTETSGIAYRQSMNGMEWTPFDNAEITRNDEGRLVVRSPYIKDPAGFVTGDLVDIHRDGKFLLKGRADSVVKIEEKRISLPEVENRILESGMARDAAVIALSGKRQYLAAVIVLNDRAKEQFAGAEKFEINKYFSVYLSRFFETVVLPKRWRYIDNIPLDAQGKKKKDDLEALFASLPGRLKISEKILEKSGSGITLEFSVPAESDYFNGHFSEIKILPAVAQVEIVIRFAARFFKCGTLAAKVKKLKFTNIIQPNDRVRLECFYKEETKKLSFTMTGADGDRLLSSGIIIMGMSVDAEQMK